MKTSRKLLAAAVLVALSSPAFAEVEFDVIGGSEISFEGLLQADGYWYHDDLQALAGASNASTIGDGSDTDFGMRRAELVFKGKGPGMWNWVVGYDAFNNKWLDTNIQYKFNGFTYVQFGQFKQPNSLEELSSTKNNDFISKAMTTNLQGISRRMGLAAGTGADNWTLTGSVFTRSLTRNDAEGNGYGFRGTWAPIFDTNSYLHLGLSYVNYEARDPGTAPGVTPHIDGDGRIQIRVRPDADLTGVRLIGTSLLTDGDRVKTAGFEGLWIHGPFKLQTEYMKSELGRSAHDNFGYDSWYVSGVCNNTGVNFGYKGGVPTTPLPNNPGSGMWQVGLRYDHADLNDGSLLTPTTVDGILAGKESNWTLGVNYYWRSNFKFALNYVKVSSEKYNPAASVHAYVDDDPSIVEFRAQVYW
jgi:phosphate-selective porin OprO/OprP